MSEPMAAGRSGNARRTLSRYVLLLAVALPLAQAGLGYAAIRTSSPWFWLAGTPIAYLLIGGLVAFSAAGGLAAATARHRGAVLGSIGGVGGAVVAALVTAVILLGALRAPQPPPSHLGPSGPAFLGLLAIFLFVPAFVGVNLLGIALATVGGLVGGTLGATRQRGGARPVRELPAEPGGQAQARGRASRRWIAVVVIAVALAIIVGVAGLVLTTGAFPAIH